MTSFCPLTLSLESEKMSNDSSPGGSQISLAEDRDVKCSDVLALPNLRLLEPNDQIRELQTIIRDK